MSQVPAGPKGTRDFYPDDMAFRQHIFDSWHRTSRRYGFELFDGPTFEHLELFTRKSGAEIEKQLYTMVDKAERQLALRPEMTPTLARMVAARGDAIKKPIRWYSIPRVFRYEKMQRGREREFFQLNLDILGIDEVSADAELIAAATGMMQDLGFNHEDFSVLVSSRKLLEEYFLFCGVPSERLTDVYALLDRRGKIPPEQYEADLAALCGGGPALDKVRRVLDSRTLDDLAAVNDSLPSLGELRELFDLVQAYGLSDYVLFDIGIVRGLAYYTGIVFELFDKKKTLRAIAGGGRYDHLVQSYGGPATPAVGFAAGDVVLGELLKDKGLAPQPGGIEVTQRLRKAGVSAEFPLKRVAIARQMKLANAARARLVLFLGGDEYRQGQAKIKDMVSGGESTVPLDSVVDAVKRALQ
jgi:histidyl-tRNA synthetase